MNGHENLSYILGQDSWHTPNSSKQNIGMTQTLETVDTHHLDQSTRPSPGLLHTPALWAICALNCQTFPHYDFIAKPVQKDI